MIEDALEVAKLLKPERPLGTYGSRVTICYCLGIIGKKVTADLRLAGKIRNQFAHQILATFSDPKISSWCKQLQWHKETMGEPPAAASDRDLFQVGVNQLVTHLAGIRDVSRLSKRKSVEGT